MLGVLLMLACVVGAVYLMVKMFQTATWHHQGGGERKARAEYGRIQREQPDSAEARLSEGEFVSQYVATKPGMARYIIGVALLVVIGLPAACTIGAVGAFSNLH